MSQGETTVGGHAAGDQEGQREHNQHHQGQDRGRHDDVLRPHEPRRGRDRRERRRHGVRALLTREAGGDSSGGSERTPIRQIAEDSDTMKALEAYIYWSNRGSRLDAGRH